MNAFIKNMALAMSISGVSLSASAAAVLGAQLENKLDTMAPMDSTMVVVSYDQLDAISGPQLQSLMDLGIAQGVQFKSLPMVGVVATAAQVQQIAALPGVRSVFANRSLQYFNADARAVTGVDKLQSEDFYQQNGIKYTGKGVTVLVNDSGIDATLDDLAYGSKVVENVQGITHAQALSLTGVDGAWIEGQHNTDLNVGHGTHCAGTVGGWGSHSDGLHKGVATDADLIGYGSGIGLSILDALGGYDYAISHIWDFNSPIRVMSNSWGSSGKFEPDNPISLASYKAYKLGILSVFAAGNDGPGEDTHNPYAQIPWGMSVGASTKQGDLIGFSSRGKRGESSSFTMPDGSEWTYVNEPTIVAPGVDIISNRSTTNAASNGGADDVGVIAPEHLPYYTMISGTSMATPHVAGVVALMLEANPELTPLEVKQLLRDSATNMSGYESWEVGAGHVNAYAAVAAALGYDEQNAKTVNGNNSFKANALLVPGGEPQAFEVLFSPVGEAQEYVFDVSEDAAWISASAEAFANTAKLKLEAPDGQVYFGNLTLPVLNTSMRVSAPAQPGQWKLSAFGLTSLSGVQADPTGTTNGPGLPEYISGEISILNSGGYEGLGDIAGHPAEHAIQYAVSERLVDGQYTNAYRPNDRLKRKDLAEYLVMGMGIRQQRDLLNQASAELSDVRSQDMPFAKAVAQTGAALKDMKQVQAPVMLLNGTNFEPNGNVSRMSLAYSLVQALGLQSTAANFTGAITVDYQGQKVPVKDAELVADELKGYVQAAIDLSIMGVRFEMEQGPYDLTPQVVAYFEPTRQVRRGDYAVIASRMFDGYLNN